MSDEHDDDEACEGCPLCRSLPGLTDADGECEGCICCSPGEDTIDTISP